MVKQKENNYIKINKNKLITFLIVPVIIFLIFWYGRMQGLNSANGDKDTKIETTIIVTPTISPTLPLINNESSGAKQNNIQKIALVNAINQKIIYCLSNGVDAVRDVNSQLQYEKNRLDSVLAEQDRCNNSCRQNTDEILKQCEGSADYETCIKKCGNDCYGLAQKQLSEIKSALNEKAKIFNEIASKYCNQ
jgi:hypothetical protein